MRSNITAHSLFRKFFVMLIENFVVFNKTYLELLYRLKLCVLVFRLYSSFYIFVLYGFFSFQFSLWYCGNIAIHTSL